MKIGKRGLTILNALIVVVVIVGSLVTLNLIGGIAKEEVTGGVIQSGDVYSGFKPKQSVTVDGKLVTLMRISKIYNKYTRTYNEYVIVRVAGVPGNIGLGKTVTVNGLSITDVSNNCSILRLKGIILPAGTYKCPSASLKIVPATKCALQGLRADAYGGVCCKGLVLQGGICNPQTNTTTLCPNDNFCSESEKFLNCNDCISNGSLIVHSSSSVLFEIYKDRYRILVLKEGVQEEFMIYLSADEGVELMIWDMKNANAIVRYNNQIHFYPLIYKEQKYYLQIPITELTDVNELELQVSITTLNNEKYLSPVYNLKLLRPKFVKIIDNGPDAEMINLYFFSQSYPTGNSSLSSFEKDVRSTLQSSPSFFNIEPFKSNENKFNVYISVFTNPYIIPGIVYLRDLLPDVNNVVAINLCYRYDPTSCDGMSGNQQAFTFQNQNILVHEFGHAFVGLGDEYFYSPIVPTNDLINRATTIYPNLDVEGCYKWCNGLDTNSPFYPIYLKYKKCISREIDPVICRAQEESELILIYPGFNGQYSGYYNVGKGCRLGTGCYQGAMTYDYGIFRSVQSSIMNNMDIYNINKSFYNYGPIGEELACKKINDLTGGAGGVCTKYK